MDPARIEDWWQGRPRPGVGVSTGPAGLLVVDVDCHPGVTPPDPAAVLPAFPRAAGGARGVRDGLDAWALLCQVAGGPPDGVVDTLTVTTPSGGRHLWFQVPNGTRWACSAGGAHRGRALGWQLDVRARGGYIVAPGTETDAGVYRAVGRRRDPALLPGWLAGALERTGHLLSQPQQVKGLRSRGAPVPDLARQTARPHSRSAWARKVTATALSEVAECARVLEGSGWSTKLNRAAFTLGGLVASGLVSSEGEARRALLEAASHARPHRARDAEMIIRSGLAAGQRRPWNPTKDR